MAVLLSQLLPGLAHQPGDRVLLAQPQPEPNPQRRGLCPQVAAGQDVAEQQVVLPSGARRRCASRPRYVRRRDLLLPVVYVATETVSYSAAAGAAGAPKRLRGVCSAGK